MLAVDARRALGRTRALKSRLKARVADLSLLAETNKEKAEALADLRLRSDNLIEERRRIEAAERARATHSAVQLGGRQLAAVERPPTVGGLLRSCTHDNAKEFIGAVADVRAALMQLFSRTAENEKLALTEAVALEETHRERDAAAALRMLHDSADRMQQRVEKRANEEKSDTTEAERLRLLLGARKAELALYDAKRATLQKELDTIGSLKAYELPPVPAAADGSAATQQQDTPNLADQIMATIQRALDELEKQPRRYYANQS